MKIITCQCLMLKFIKLWKSSHRLNFIDKNWPCTTIFSTRKSLFFVTSPPFSVCHEKTSKKQRCFFVTSWDSGILWSSINIAILWYSKWIAPFIDDEFFLKIKWKLGKILYPTKRCFPLWKSLFSDASPPKNS